MKTRISTHLTYKLGSSIGRIGLVGCDKSDESLRLRVLTGVAMPEAEQILNPLDGSKEPLIRCSSYS